MSRESEPLLGVKQPCSWGHPAGSLLLPLLQRISGSSRAGLEQLSSDAMSLRVLSSDPEVLALRSND